MSSATEGTVNTLMAEFLRSKGIETTTEVSGTLGKKRQQVDFQITNGGVFNGEGEWQSSYIDGYNQAIGYGELPGAAGYFLIGYPDKLAQEIEQKRLAETSPEVLLSGVEYRGMFKTKSMSQPSIFRGGLEDIPDWIRDAIQDKPRVDSEEYITLMRDIVTGLTEFIPDAEEYPNVFEHIIGDMPQEEEEFSAAQDAAAYLLLNQVVFYRILAEQNYELIDPDEIDSPLDLHEKYFSVVLEHDYEAIFDLDIVSFIPQKAVQFIRDMVQIVNELRPEQFTTDLLGNAFHELIPLEVRKPVAAYYTNPMAARLLSNLTIHDGDDAVADFACGSGTLLMAAYDRKIDLIRGTMAEEVHRDFVEKELTGIDIMPFAGHLAAVQLGLRNPGYFTDKPRIAIRDSTTLNPGESIDTLSKSLPSGQSRISSGWSEDEVEGRKIGAGAVSSAGEGTQFEVNQVDAILMNPPFTRKQHISSEYRSELNRRFSDYSEYLDAGMGLYAYFVFLADRFLKPRGRLGLVIPTGILQQQSTEGIRRLLQENYNLEHIISTDYRSAFSEDTSRREILIVAEKHDREDVVDTPVRISSLKMLPSSDNLEQITSWLTDESKKDMSNDTLEMHEIPQSDFEESLDWMSIVRDHVGFYFDYPNLEGMDDFETQYNSIIRGIRYHKSSEKVHPHETLLSKDRDADVTKDWVVISEDEETVTAQSKYTAVTLDIPREALEPAIRSISGQRTIQVDDPPDHIVMDRFEGDNEFWESSQPTEVLNNRRTHVDKRRCHLIIAGAGNLDVAAGGTSFFAVVSENPIIPTWTFNSVMVPSFERAKLIALWWNSTFSLARLVSERTEVRGSLMQWRQGELKSIPVPDFSSLSSDEVDELMELYQDIQSIEFPSIIQQLDSKNEHRIKIDETWAEILGWEYYQDEEQLERLYIQFAQFLHQLQELMERD